MIAYRFDEKTHEFVCEQNCQRDPVESEKLGRDVYLTPAQCTLVRPPAKIAGFVSVFNGNSWDSVEDYRGHEYWPAGAGFYDAPVIMHDLGKIPAGASMTRPAKSAKEVCKEKIDELKAELTASDYKCMKFADGALTEREYAPVRARRAELRAEINRLEAML